VTGEQGHLNRWLITILTVIQKSEKDYCWYHLYMCVVFKWGFVVMHDVYMKQLKNKNLSWFCYKYDLTVSKIVACTHYESLLRLKKHSNNWEVLRLVTALSLQKMPDQNTHSGSCPEPVSVSGRKRGQKNFLIFNPFHCWTVCLRCCVLTSLPLTLYLWMQFCAARAEPPQQQLLLCRMCSICSCIPTVISDFLSSQFSEA